ncbi:hypothetical protein DICPUDRAFT_29264 [Dictyostelium purpureum]|uniref:Ran guanine nucleotide release factor n=1 Tax=Dictyostelium purpureum TaxID=5786 RepID=F0ZD87_DICPU|nr:uncharacterized protein DICPUDRAFT_29264 [Dictyostelium purpureum]EGC38065.1 hypothetical protein DICPUDRAFT_29264 [Dictyostelium purpureum]|eukprot:XP_003285372.1 hypothetical protein DICPUDRAFT_29264 [Dictyostelium purpureum]
MTSNFVKRPLYGGAIEISIPERFRDITQFRQVPDHQEVFVDEKSDQSFIVELNEKQSVVDDQAILFHYENLTEELELPKEKSVVLNQRKLTNDELPNFPNNPKYILLAQQKVAKFKESAENTVNLYMLLVRLEKQNTDILIILNDTIEISPASSSKNAQTQTNQSEVEALFLNSIKSFKINDYSLFQNN